MAIAPESSETFAREVDENLRADKVRDVARTYGKWAILGVILLLVAIGAFLYYRDHQAKQRAADSEALAGVIENIGSDNLTTVPARAMPILRHMPNLGDSRITGEGGILAEGLRFV